MRITFFGDGPWARRSLPKLAGLDDVEIVLVVGRSPEADEGLETTASSIGVPFATPVDVNAPDFLERLKGLEADLHVSMSYDQILRAGFLQTASTGAINCHAGKLPFYRGRNVLNWVLINGEDHFGVTVHHVDEGIDTGDIILQREIAIAPEDDYADVLRAAEAVCADVLVEAVKRLRDGTAERVPQATIHPVGFYCGRRRPGDEWVDWRLTSERIHNFVRGIAVPGPAARTIVDGQEVAILRSRLIPEAVPYVGIPGEVVGRDEAGVVVKTGDTTLQILEFAEVDVTGTRGEEQRPSWKIGTRCLGKP